MRNVRHIGLGSLVVATVAGLIVATLHVTSARDDVTASADVRSATAAAARKPDLALSASRRTVDAGQRVTLRIRTTTKHARSVRVQRWDAGRKAWRQVAKRTVRASRSLTVTPPRGTTRYRVVGARVRHRAGGKLHTHRAARSATVSVTSRARIAAHRPVALDGDERTLLGAVASARAAYARPAVVSATDEGADACLTAYARKHSAWMAQQGRALDPGSPEHVAAGRPMPSAECPGRTVWALTRAVGSPTETSKVVSTSVDAWLASPYGETARLLTTCHTAPAFEFGVAAPKSADTRWLTVLVASLTSTTTSSGEC